MCKFTKLYSVHVHVSNAYQIFILSNTFNLFFLCKSYQKFTLGDETKFNQLYGCMLSGIGNALHTKI